MKTQDQLAEHDLNLTFDTSGRLWRFRPTHSAHGHQPVDAGIIDSTLVITVTVPGIKAGDADLRVKGDVLEMRGRTDGTMDLAADIGLPMITRLRIRVNNATRRRIRMPADEQGRARRVARRTRLR